MRFLQATLRRDGIVHGGDVCSNEKDFDRSDHDA